MHKTSYNVESYISIDKNITRRDIRVNEARRRVQKGETFAEL
jgi:hypothetical protein